jgi:hypothetical protein
MAAANWACAACCKKRGVPQPEAFGTGLRRPQALVQRAKIGPHRGQNRERDHADLDVLPIDQHREQRRSQSGEAADGVPAPHCQRLAEIAYARLGEEH